MADLGLDLMLGIGIMFGLAFVMTYLTYKDFETFFIWLTIFSAFVVWGGLIDLWIIVINLIVLSVILVRNIYQKRSL